MSVVLNPIVPSSGALARCERGEDKSVAEMVCMDFQPIEDDSGNVQEESMAFVQPIQVAILPRGSRILTTGCTQKGLMRFYMQIALAFIQQVGYDWLLQEATNLGINRDDIIQLHDLETGGLLRTVLLHCPIGCNTNNRTGQLSVTLVTVSAMCKVSLRLDMAALGDHDERGNFIPPNPALGRRDPESAGRNGFNHMLAPQVGLREDVKQHKDRKCCLHPVANVLDAIKKALALRQEIDPPQHPRQGGGGGQEEQKEGGSGATFVTDQGDETGEEPLRNETSGREGQEPPRRQEDEEMVVGHEGGGDDGEHEAEEEEVASAAQATDSAMEPEGQQEEEEEVASFGHAVEEEEAAAASRDEEGEGEEEVDEDYEDDSSYCPSDPREDDEEDDGSGSRYWGELVEESSEDEGEALYSLRNRTRGP